MPFALKPARLAFGDKISTLIRNIVDFYYISTK